MKLFHQITSILVALVLMFTFNYKSILTIDFFIHQVEITELFCINKEKPELQCNGKCHLAKQLVKVDQEKKEAPFSSSTTIANLEINLTLFIYKIDLTPNTKVVKNLFNSYGHHDLREGYLSITTPPPKVLV